MTKEEEIMRFLEEHIFEPILSSSSASKKLKQGVRLTKMRMGKRDDEGMRHYYWSAIVGTEKSIGFAKILKKEGHILFV